MTARYPFLEDNMGDREAAERLTRILEEAVGAGTFDQVVDRLRDALVERARVVLHREFHALSSQIGPLELVKDFGYQLGRVMRRRKHRVESADDLFGVACTQFRRKLLDRVRQTARRQRLQEKHQARLLPRQAQDPSDIVHQRELLRAVLETVDASDETDRRIFDLRFFHGLPWRGSAGCSTCRRPPSITASGTS